MKGRILVTGGTGMIGVNLVRRLAETGSPQSRLFITCRPNSDLCYRLADCSCTFVPMDLNERSQIDDAIEAARPEVVFHLASTIWSRVPEHESHQHYQTNVLGTQYLLEAVRRVVPDARFVFSGSSAAYGPGRRMGEDRLPAPTTVYGASKAAVSTLLQTYGRLYGLNGVELRLFTPYGPWEDGKRLIPAVIRSILSDCPLQLTAGTQERDFVYVDDVVDALIRAADVAGPECEVINIGSGQGTTVRHAAETIVRVCGRDAKLAFGTLDQRSDEMWQMSADICKAQALLDWQPRTRFEEGVRCSFEWWSQYDSRVVEPS